MRSLPMLVLAIGAAVAACSTEHSGFTPTGPAFDTSSLGDTIHQWRPGGPTFSFAPCSGYNIATGRCSPSSSAAALCSGYNIASGRCGDTSGVVHAFCSGYGIPGVECGTNESGAVARPRVTGAADCFSGYIIAYNGDTVCLGAARVRRP